MPELILTTLPGELRLASRFEQLAIAALPPATVAQMIRAAAMHYGGSAPGLVYIAGAVRLNVSAVVLIRA